MAKSTKLKELIHKFSDTKNHSNLFKSSTKWVTLWGKYWLKVASVPNDRIYPIFLALISLFSFQKCSKISFQHEAAEACPRLPKPAQDCQNGSTCERYWLLPSGCLKDFLSWSAYLRNQYRLEFPDLRYWGHYFAVPAGLGHFCGYDGDCDLGQPDLAGRSYRLMLPAWPLTVEGGIAET